MLRRLRWQIGLAAAGVLIVGAVLIAVSNRAFEDRPAPGGEAVEAVVGRVATFNPVFAASEVEVDVARLVHAGLTRVDADGAIVPDLAARWSISDDALVYEFELRPDAVWQDGQPVTPRDVAFTAAVAADGSIPTEKNPLAAAWALVNVEVLDGTTVRLRLDEPYAPLLDATTMGLLPEHILGAVPHAELPRNAFSTREPIGAGPWRLDLPGGVSDESIRLVRFEEHWSPERPLLDALVLRTFDTPEDAWGALGRREVQLMCGLAAPTIEGLGEDVQEISTIRADYTLVFLNPAGVLFQDLVVRTALSLAIDRAALVADPEVLGGLGVVGFTPIAPGSPAYAPAPEAPVFDPAEAIRSLEAAGWIDSDGDGIRDRDGKALRFVLDTFDEPLLTRLADRLARSWAAIGAGVEVRAQPQPNMIRALSDRAYETALFRVSSRMTYTPDLYPLWHSSQAVSGQNFASFSDPTADSVLVELRRTPPDRTEERLELYRRFQELFVEQIPSLVLFHPAFTCAKVDATLGGVQLPRLVVEPADRHATLDEWFVRTERISLGD